MSEIKAQSKKIYAARKVVADLEAEYAELRLKLLREVTITNRGETVTLHRGKRAVKAKKMGVNRRWKVWEGNKVLLSDYAGGSLHDIRFLLATDQI